MLMFHILYHYKFEKNPLTIKDHVDILNKNGEVWWGVFGKGMGEKKTKEVKNQISNGLETKAILTASNSNLYRYHVARIKDVVTMKEPWFPSDRPELIPFYYRGNEIMTWFKFASIEEVDKNILQQYTLQSNTKRDLEESLRGQTSIMYIVDRTSLE